MTGWEFCGGYWWLFPLVMIFFCFLFMGRCFRRGMRGSYGRGWCGLGDWDVPRESAEDVLKNRYARGEIDRTEYEEKKKVLAGDGGMQAD